MSGYWNGRFEAEGRIWGGSPSRTAERAEEIFRTNGVKTVLVPGAGYGRNSEFFADRGYEVTGIEVSDEALRMAPANTAVRYVRGSVLEVPLGCGQYDAVYCFNVLHLFLRDDRDLFLGKCRDALREDGIAFFVVFSEKEPQFGRGRIVEENTFESKPGRPTHFFTEEDLRESFRGFEVIDTALAEDREDHGTEGPHVHVVRYICARKKGAHEFDGEKYRTASGHQKEWGRAIIASLGLKGDERVLDLGCGDGALTAEIARLLPRGSALGIDASEGMIREARSIEGGNLSFTLMDIRELSFEGEFDAIFSNATLHWVKDHGRLLAACRRALRGNGVFRFNFAGHGNCASFNAVVRDVMRDGRFAEYFMGFEWPWYMPEIAEYEGLVAACGGIEEVRVWGENVDRFFTRDALVRWIDQPSIVPFVRRIPQEEKDAFRDAVVEGMLSKTRRSENSYFETFRRINVFARKPVNR
jgi:trans-aconitate 2-methyltransferase